MTSIRTLILVDTGEAIGSQFVASRAVTDEGAVIVGAERRAPGLSSTVAVVCADGTLIDINARCKCSHVQLVARGTGASVAANNIVAGSRTASGTHRVAGTRMNQGRIGSCTLIEINAGLQIGGQLKARRAVAGIATIGVGARREAAYKSRVSTAAGVGAVCTLVVVTTADPIRKEVEAVRAATGKGADSVGAGCGAALCCCEGSTGADRCSRTICAFILVNASLQVAIKDEARGWETAAGVATGSVCALSNTASSRHCTACTLVCALRALVKVSASEAISCQCEAVRAAAIVGALGVGASSGAASAKGRGITDTGQRYHWCSQPTLIQIFTSLAISAYDVTG